MSVDPQTGDPNLRQSLQALEFLASPQGRQLLDRLAPAQLGGRKLLAAVAKLRVEIGPAAAALAVEMAAGRGRAAAKFGPAYPRWFTREALEQASGIHAAGHRAHRLAAAGTVLELCTGMGGDTLALARAGLSVVSVDAGALLSRMAALNLQDLGLDGRVTLVVGLAESQPLNGFSVCYADPSRRRDGRRSTSLDLLSPDIGFLGDLARRLPGACVKLAPASSTQALAAAFPGAEIEFVSVGGELKEAVAWTGELAGSPRRATLLPADLTLAGRPEGLQPAPKPLRYVAEPDPAVIRSGLFAELARSAGLPHFLLAQDVAFLTADDVPSTPLAGYFKVVDFMPASLRRVGRRLRALNAGNVAVIRRGYPQPAAAVLETLHPYLEGELSYVLFLYRSGREHFAVIAESGSAGRPT